MVEIKMVEFHQIGIALAATRSPAGDSFGQDARTGPVGPGPVQGADAGRTDAARARFMVGSVVAEPWCEEVALPARPAREQPGLYVVSR